MNKSSKHIDYSDAIAKKKTLQGTVIGAVAFDGLDRVPARSGPLALANITDYPAGRAIAPVNVLLYNGLVLVVFLVFNAAEKCLRFTVH